MILHTKHTIRFDYDPPVFLEPTTIRMRPRQDPHQELKAFKLDITPTPAGRADTLDAHNNAATLVWFDGTHQSLAMTAQATVHTKLTDPFNYLLTTPQDKDDLAPYLHRHRPHPDVTAFADRATANAADPIDLLNRLLAAVHERCKHTTRLTGPPHPPAHTLAHKQGTCRDLTVLFIDAVRSLNIPARFVTGYLHDHGEENQLHAWAETFLPGPGWRGYDPSLALATADRHIALAAAPHPADTNPTTGSFRADNPNVRLTYNLQITSDQPAPNLSLNK